LAQAVALIRIRNTFDHLYFRRRYTVLFFTLVFTVVASPIFSILKLRGFFIESVLAISLVAAVLPINFKRRRIHLVFIAAALVARPVASLHGDPVISAIVLVTWTLIGLCAAGTALRFAMKGKEVDAEHISAALSAYLLAGIYFGLLYWVLEQIRPETFSLTGEFSRGTASYFSFVTLATIGYGDIVPRTDVARSLAVMEGVGGQLFLAVLVARLLSLYPQSRGKE
jgi:hypothetical protein